MNYGSCYIIMWNSVFPSVFYYSKGKKEKKKFTMVAHLLNKDLNSIFSDLTFAVWYVKWNKPSGLPEIFSEKISHCKSTLKTLEDRKYFIALKFHSTNNKFTFSFA